MKLELIVPTSLKDIPLKSYQTFVKMREASNDEDFVAQKMIEIFCGIELKDVVKMRLTDVNELLVSFNQIFNEKPKFQNRFNLHGIEYGFIPKLEDLTLEEFTNLEQLMKSWDTFHMAMAVMYRPIKLEVKGTYEIHDYFYSEDMGEIFKLCPLDIALSARVFFWNLASELLSAIPSYLEKELAKNPSLMNEVNSANSGGGIRSIMHLLTENLKTLDLSENENLLRLSRF
jgi:hypothetical protein